MGCCCLSIWMSSEEEQVCGKKEQVGGMFSPASKGGILCLYLVAVFQRPGQNNLGVFVTKSCFCPGV